MNMDTRGGTEQNLI